MTKSPLVIYHNNCADGFGAAWAVRRALPDAEFHPGNYGHEPPDVTGRDVIVVDFSFKNKVLREMEKSASSILILDHHKSAEEELQAGSVIRMDGWDAPSWEEYLSDTRESPFVDTYALFDMERSGAGIAWDFFHPGVPRPPLINHIEDRDLWRFALTWTREVQANVFSHEYDFDVWDKLMSANIYELAQEGAALERKHKKDVRELVTACKRKMVIDGVEVWAANVPYIYTSDAGNMMADGMPFAACYWDTASNRQFSLRSTECGVDVSVIASKFGGGGHARAAGFRLPHGVSPEVAP